MCLSIFLKTYNNRLQTSVTLHRILSSLSAGIVTIWPTITSNDPLGNETKLTSVGKGCAIIGGTEME